jgi:hypothetical protein
MVRKSRPGLFCAGILMILWNTLVVVSLFFLISGAFFAVVGVYLIIWATLGKGCWCRNCKRFNVS